MNTPAVKWVVDPNRRDGSCENCYFQDDAEERPVCSRPEEMESCIRSVGGALRYGMYVLEEKETEG